MDTKKVLFLAYNQHQFKLFRYLCINLEQETTFLVTSVAACLKGILHRNGQPPLPPTILDELVKYSYLSFSARRQQGKADLLSRLYYKYLIFKAKTLHNYYYHYLKNKAIDLLVVWNGSYLEAASGVKAARKLGIKVIFMENGFFPQTLVLDEKGVNAANSLVGNTAEFYRKVRIDPVKLARLKGTKLVPRELRKNITIKEEIQLPQKYFFLPFQVHTDTQVLLNSPNIRNMYELVDTVYTAVEAYNCKSQADYWLVIKEHPSDFGRIDYRDLKEKYQGRKVVFITTEPSSTLIERSQAVITINSTVGIEALLKGKPVITLGKAFYNVEGVVYHCANLSQLGQVITRALTEEINHGLVDQLLYYLRYDYLVEVDKKNLNPNNIMPVLQRIRGILGNDLVEK
ncbi:MAG TPA: hypothetical protein DD789_07210 [Firmicutes bacterium]|jgi:capsular polysaccharide export protein|nr:hypothetical protein [Bacillota bacterium]